MTRKQRKRRVSRRESLRRICFHSLFLPRRGIPLRPVTVRCPQFRRSRVTCTGELHIDRVLTPRPRRRIRTRTRGPDGSINAGDVVSPLVRISHTGYRVFHTRVVTSRAMLTAGCYCVLFSGTRE